MILTGFVTEIFGSQILPHVLQIPSSPTDQPDSIMRSPHCQGTFLVKDWKSLIVLINKH